ncbi:MAG: response regulator [Humidesulfovibrio sp.]|nr:response regulator [Humidesulfovibrio sp.]
MPEQKHSVIVIDDEERVRELLIDYLDECDEFELRGACSGEAALEMLQLRPADLCVVDLRLPGIDGAEFIMAASEAKLCRRFLVHTGSVDFLLPQALVEGLGMATEDVFYKPVDAATLLARIRERLAGRMA